jgi:2-methylcitrate dehydratase PrpD
MITKKLAHFVVETRMEDIPQEALKIAQMGITDFVGVTFPGSLEPHSEIVRGYVRKMGGVAESSIIGSNLKTSPYLAALANGTMGHALDYDDMGGFGHPSVVLAPAVLAIGESIGASGKDILAAYVIGFEVAALLHGTLWTHYLRGWHGTDNFGSLGAGAAVARLLRLNVHQVRMVLGIAASLAGGLRQNFGTMTKPLHAGQAAANGIQAALLAQAGLTADDSIIEAPLGFAKVFGHDQEVDWEKASEGLGKTFNITALSTNGIAIKPYPSCGCTHAGIDAALSLKERYRLKSEDIAEVEMGTSPYEGQVLIHHRPKSGLEGKFSLEYTVARALHSGEVKLKHFTDEGVDEPAIKKLIERMKWVEKYPTPSFGKQRDSIGTQSVTVKLADGMEYSHEVRISKGWPQRPLTSEELISKYKDCASTVLSKEGVDKSLGMLTKLAGVKNIRDLMETVTRKDTKRRAR